MRGIINIAGFIHLNVIPTTATPAALSTISALTQTTDVEMFQNGTSLFLESLSSKPLPFALAQQCLGNVMVQPRSVTMQMLSRTQDETRLMEVGRAGTLPLLLIHGSEDGLVKGRELPKLLEGWKNMTVVELPGADHMPWLSDAERFRDSVLSWVEVVLTRELW